MQHILVPTDFSETSNVAIDRALPLAKLSGARVTLLHVIYGDKLNEALLGLDAVANLSRTLDLGPDATSYVPGYDLAAIHSAAEKKLDDIVNQADHANVTIATAVRDGRPSKEIIDFANQSDVDMIVMGTHGRGPVGRMFLGSVTENVIRASDIPVLVIRK